MLTISFKTSLLLLVLKRVTSHLKFLQEKLFAQFRFKLSEISISLTSAKTKGLFLTINSEQMPWKPSWCLKNHSGDLKIWQAMDCSLTRGWPTCVMIFHPKIKVAESLFSSTMAKSTINGKINMDCKHLMKKN